MALSAGASCISCSIRSPFAALRSKNASLIADLAISLSRSCALLSSLISRGSIPAAAPLDRDPRHLLQACRWPFCLGLLKGDADRSIGHQTFPIFALAAGVSRHRLTDSRPASGHSPFLIRVTLPAAMAASSVACSSRV